MTNPTIPASPILSPSAGGRNRRATIFGVLITLFWCGMMFTLLKDKILPQRQAQVLASKTVAPSTLTATWKDSDEFMTVKMGAKEVGGAITRVRRIQRGQLPYYQADFRLGVGLNILGVPRTASIHGRGHLDASFDLSDFVIAIDLSSYKIEVAGEMVGEELLVEMRQGKQVTRSRYKLERRISMLDAVRPVVTRNFQIKPGNQIAIPVIDPIWSMNQGTLQMTVGEPESIRIGSQTVEAFPIVMKLNEFVSTSWVDKEGSTLRRQLAGGLTMEKSTAEAVRTRSPNINREIQVKPINPQDFAGIAAKPIQRLSDQGKTPLETLGALVPR